MKYIITTIMMCCTGLMAQGEDVETKNIEVRSVGWEKVTQQLYYKTDVKAEEVEASYKELKLYDMTASHAFKMKVSDRIDIYRKVGAGDGVRFVKVSSAKIKPDCDRYLLMVFPKDAKKSVYPSRAIADDRTHAPWGSYQIYNFTSQTLNGGLHKQGFSIKSNGTKLIKVNGNNQLKMPFVLWYQKGEEKKWLARNTWVHNQQKHLKFFVTLKSDVRGRARVQAKSLAEYMDPDEVAINRP